MSKLRTRLYVIGVISLFLTSCASSQQNVKRSENDLELVKLGVRTLAQSREPAGEVKWVKDAETGGQVFDLALDLEDVDYLHERDKELIVDFVDRAMDLIGLARNPCTFFDFKCRAEARRLNKAGK